MKICYSISQSGDRSFWTRIGVAFVNRDGSLNVKLNCLPVNGEMTIRDYEPNRSRDSESKDYPKHNHNNVPPGQEDEEFPF